MKRAKANVREGVCEVDSFDPASVARARQAMPGTEAVVLAATALGALSHPARLRLVLALDGRELCVCDCAQVLGASLSGTSQHLKELRMVGAITFRAEGKMAYYRLADRRWLAISEAAVRAASSPARVRASA